MRRPQPPAPPVPPPPAVPAPRSVVLIICRHDVVLLLNRRSQASTFAGEQPTQPAMLTHTLSDIDDVVAHTTKIAATTDRGQISREYNDRADEAKRIIEALRAQQQENLDTTAHDGTWEVVYATAQVRMNATPPPLALPPERPADTHAPSRSFPTPPHRQLFRASPFFMAIQYAFDSANATWHAPWSSEDTAVPSGDLFFRLHDLQVSARDESSEADGSDPPRPHAQRTQPPSC